MMQVVLPDWYLRIGIKDGSVVEVDYGNSILSATLSTLPTVERVKQWLADAAEMLDGK